MSGRAVEKSGFLSPPFYYLMISSRYRAAAAIPTSGPQKYVYLVPLHKLGSKYLLLHACEIFQGSSGKRLTWMM